MFPHAFLQEQREKIWKVSLNIQKKRIDIYIRSILVLRQVYARTNSFSSSHLGLSINSAIVIPSCQIYAKEEMNIIKRPRKVMINSWKCVSVMIYFILRRNRMIRLDPYLNRERLHLNTAGSNFRQKKFRNISNVSFPKEFLWAEFR